MTKSSLCQEDITIINAYFPKKALQIRETKLTEKRERNGHNNNNSHRDINNLWAAMPRTTKHKLQSVNTPHMWWQQTDIHDQECPTESFNYGQNVRQDRPHTGVQASCNKSKKMKIIHSIFSNPNGIKFKICNSKISFKSPKYLEIEQYISA